MIRKVLSRIYSFLERNHNSYKISRLRLQDLVSITGDFIQGNGTEFFAHKGACVRIDGNVATRRFCNFLIHSGATLSVGQNVFFNNFCSVNCLGSISIGEDTLFGEGVKIYDHNHSYNYSSDKLTVAREKFNIGAVKIGKNCWIGSNVTILNNVEIGDNVIIGSNCLIYQSVPANSIVRNKAELLIQPIGG